MQKLSLVCQALRNEKVVEFTSYVLSVSYQSHFGDHATEINSLIDDCLSALVKSQENMLNPSGLQRAGILCNQQIFDSHEHYQWFRKSYADYRSSLKVKYEYSIIQEYLIPGTILDFGSGDGYFAELLTKNGYSVWGTDIRDYRSSYSKDFTFSLMRTPRDLGSIPIQFDNTIVKSVLHHIDERYIEEDIQLLRRKTSKRLIIKEDICPLDTGDNILNSSRRKELYTKYKQLSSDEQLQYLVLMDFFGNYVVQGLSFINLPFNFHSLSEWITLLKRCGFSIIQTISKEFDVEMFHPGPHVWLICDVVV